MDFIKGNEEFKLGGKGLKTLNYFEKNKNFKFLKLLFFHIFITLPYLRSLESLRTYPLEIYK